MKDIDTSNRLITPKISVHENGLSHSQLSLGISATREFFNGSPEKVMGVIIEEVEEISRLAREIPGFMGCFGLGYPFYAQEPSTGDIYQVPSITDHLQDAQKRIDASMEYTGDNWPCVGCQRTNYLPDLKTYCNPCDQTLFKPRDLFRSLPDIDVVIVAANPTEKTEMHLQSLLIGLGLVQSDNDIEESFRRTVSLLNGESDSKLPVDAHIWDLTKFVECCRIMRESPAQIDNLIQSRSLHSKWQDRDINFWFDFIFSFREIGDVDPDLQAIINKTRSVLVRDLGVDKIITLVESVSERGRAIITDPQMRRILKQRISLW